MMIHIVFPKFFLSSCLLIWCTHLTAMMPTDTCIANDDCEQAILISGIVTDQSFVCVTGCNMYASPDSLIESCQMGDFPTVWYTPDLDPNVRVINIEVRNAEFESPVISVFKSSSGCDSMEQVLLSNSNLACIIGTGGIAKAIGIEVDPDQQYYIAISSIYSIGGNFDLCLSAQSIGSYCAVDRGIEITGRSNGGPLEGPFDPGETVSVCMNVYSFSALNNDCQWFQGLVPVFGNGWDPVSFDLDDQPLQTRINGDTIGEEGNGVYGSSTWDWFADVDYHHDHPSLTIADLDSNGRLDMCNSVHEIDCPHQGLSGGCCGPCWGDTIGTFLPNGWFAYGINGTCPTPGPPIRVDWGDGNSCGPGMGPWYFCFDLKTRQIPDCAGDSSRRDLSLGFYTFADGETGSWTGDASVCSYDTPTKLSLKALCGRVSTTETEILDPRCTGDTLRYFIESPGIDYWEWNISPFWAARYSVNQGQNGVQIEVPLENTGNAPIDIHATLVGHEPDSGNMLIRKFTFKLNDVETCGITSTGPNPKADESRVRIYPMPAGDQVRVEWSFDIRRSATIDLYDVNGVLMKQVQVDPESSKMIPLSLLELPVGVYYLNFYNEEFKYVRKMVRM